MCVNCGVPKCSCEQVTSCSPCNGKLTDFSCVEFNGDSKPAIGLDKYDTLSDWVSALQDIMATLQNDNGKVLVDPTATVMKTLSELVQPGANMSITLIGAGASKKLRFDSSVGGVVPDINVKVSSTDTTSSYLFNKIETGNYITKNISPSGATNQKLVLDVDTQSLISADASNKIVKGFDDGLFFDGITRLDPAYNGAWNPLVITGTTPAGVTLVLNNAFYRVAYDGTIQFKGYIDFTANFTKYTSANTTWQYSFVLTSLSSMLSGTFTSGQVGVSTGQNRMVSSQTIIEAPATLISPDTFPKITQMKGYDIEWSTTNLTARLYGIYEAASTAGKAIRVSLEGCSIAPNL